MCLDLRAEVLAIDFRVASYWPKDVVTIHTEGQTYIYIYIYTHTHKYYAVEPGYNDIDLCDTSSRCIPSDILWYQLIPSC